MDLMEKKKKIKEKKPPAPHWSEMVAIWFDFCRAHFKQKPTFDGSAPRDLKNIVSVLQKRAEDKKLEWTLKVASEKLGGFLLAAYNHADGNGVMWLRDHFTLFNINRQKDIIFFKAAQNIKQYGRREESIGSDTSSNRQTSNDSKIKPSGSFGEL